MFAMTLIRKKWVKIKNFLHKTSAFLYNLKIWTVSTFFQKENKVLITLNLCLTHSKSWIIEDVTNWYVIS